MCACVSFGIFLHLWKPIEFANVSKFFTFYCIFFDCLQKVTIFLRLNIVHVSRRLTYQLFRTESSAGESCVVCFFDFELKLFKLFNCLPCSISFYSTHAQTKHFYVVFFVQFFNFILLKFQIRLQSHPSVFFQPGAFLVEYLNRVVPFIALKYAYFLLDRYTF